VERRSKGIAGPVRVLLLSRRCRRFSFLDVAMTDRETLLTLAERVEQAAAPDRISDQIIAVLIGGWQCKWFSGGPSPGFYWRHGDYSWTKDGETPPYYTASLDAAVTLYAVPPEVIPSCPRKASAAALRARAAMG
jgi:hypothetical protein